MCECGDEVKLKLCPIWRGHVNSGQLWSVTAVIWSGNKAPTIIPLQFGCGVLYSSTETEQQSPSNSQSDPFNSASQTDIHLRDSTRINPSCPTYTNPHNLASSLHTPRPPSRQPNRPTHTRSSCREEDRRSILPRRTGTR